MKNIATIEKRNNSYRFIVSCGYDMTGKQIEKEVQRQATLFEERCLKGQVLDENIRFAEFAEIWMKDRKNDLRPRTYARYESLLPRINAAIGHIKLCKIQPPHLRAFYANLAESGVRLDTKYSCNISIDDQSVSVTPTPPPPAGSTPTRSSQPTTLPPKSSTIYSSNRERNPL